MKVVTPESIAAVLRREIPRLAYEVPADSFAIHHKVHYGYFG